MGFVIWTCAWFITVELCMLITAKTRAIEGRRAMTADERGAAGCVALVIWIVGIVIVL
jgi:hypothetical protein